MTIRSRQIVDEAPVDIGVATKIHSGREQAAVGGRRRTRRPRAATPGFKSTGSFTIVVLYLSGANLHVPSQKSFHAFRFISDIISMNNQ